MKQVRIALLDICPSCGSTHPQNGSCQGGDGSAALAQATRADNGDFKPGQVLQGRYELLHVLGQGGMGTVYMSRDLRLKGRHCVVKKLRDDFFREEDRQKAQAFFEREMQVLSHLQHRNIVQILDFFSENYNHYLVMEYVQGNNLHYMLHDERGGVPFSENTVVEWAIQICDVLSYLHSQVPPVIYRDLKPSNVMIDLKGEVKLVDFGIARPWEEEAEHTHVVSAGYSPPEQYWGQADPRSDIYALGATMHFLLTGKDPEALHVSSPVSLNPDVSAYTDKLVQTATSQELDKRFQNVEEFLEALLHKDYVPAPETAKSRMGEIVTGLILLIVATFIFVVENMGSGGGEPQAQPDKAAPAMMKGERDGINIDERVFNSRLNTATTGPGAGQKTGARTDQNQTDLAVQVIDEKSLTDPSGLPTADKPPFGLNIPWFNQGN